MLSDVPLGVLLSGGVDSSLVASLVAECASGPVPTFTVGYDIGDVTEISAARRTAEAIGAEHHTLTLTQGEVAGRLASVMAQIDQPLADQALVPLDAVSELARKHVTVALGGEGADELFGRYPGTAGSGERPASRTWFPLASRAEGRGSSAAWSAASAHATSPTCSSRRAPSCAMSTGSPIVASSPGRPSTERGSPPSPTPPRTSSSRSGSPEAAARRPQGRGTWCARSAHVARRQRARQSGSRRDARIPGDPDALPPQGGRRICGIDPREDSHTRSGKRAAPHAPRQARARRPPSTVEGCVSRAGRGVASRTARTGPPRSGRQGIPPAGGLVLKVCDEHDRGRARGWWRRSLGCPLADSDARPLVGRVSKPRAGVLKTLIITPDFPPALGGIQTLIHRIAMHTRGLDTRVVTLATPGAVGFDREQPFTVRRVRTPLCSRHAAVATLNAVAIREGAAFRPDVVLSGHIVTSPAASAMRLWRSVPVVQYLYGSELNETRQRLVRHAIRNATAIIAISRYTKDRALAWCPRGQGFTVIPPGVDLPERRPSDIPGANGRPRLVSVARLEDRYKGHDVVMRAMPLVLARVPEAEWVIVGDGPLRGHLERLAAMHGVSRQVRFVGAVPDEERDGWLDQAALLAMPSRLPARGAAGEGFGIVYLEAGARGIPVVAGRVAGALDAVVDGRPACSWTPTITLPSPARSHRSWRIPPGLASSDAAGERMPRSSPGPSLPNASAESSMRWQDADGDQGPLRQPHQPRQRGGALAARPTAWSPA